MHVTVTVWGSKYVMKRDRKKTAQEIKNNVDYTVLLWQKETSDKSDISRKRAKCVCHFHWRQWNIVMS